MGHIRHKGPTSINVYEDGDPVVVPTRKKEVFDNASGNAVVVPGSSGTLPADPNLVDVIIEGIGTLTEGVGNDYTLAGNTVNFTWTFLSPRRVTVIWWEGL